MVNETSAVSSPSRTRPATSLVHAKLAAPAEKPPLTRTRSPTDALRSGPVSATGGISAATVTVTESVSGRPGPSTVSVKVSTEPAAGAVNVGVAVGAAVEGDDRPVGLLPGEARRAERAGAVEPDLLALLHRQVRPGVGDTHRHGIERGAGDGDGPCRAAAEVGGDGHGGRWGGRGGRCPERRTRRR